MSRAVLHELLIYATSHPLALVVAEAARRVGPVVHVPGVGYLVSDADVLKEILHQDTTFSKTGGGSMGPIVTQLLGDNALLNMDGAAHRALRARLGDLFSASYVDWLVREVVDPPVADVERTLARGGSVDLVRFAHVLTGRVTCQMLGVRLPPGDEDRAYEEIFRLGERLVAFVGLSTRSLSPRQLREQKVYSDRLVAFARASYESADDGADTISRRLRSLGLSFDEARGIIAVLFLVGMVTVSTAIPRIVALLVDTRQISVLRRRPELLPAAIDEGLRYVVPVPVIARSVETDACVGGHHFSNGKRVLLFPYNAFKDARLYPRPWAFDINRTPDPRVRNLWFGAGPHFCIGFGLAHRELSAVLGAFARLQGDLQVVRRRYARGVLIPAYARLEVRLRP